MGKRLAFRSKEEMTMIRRNNNKWLLLLFAALAVAALTGCTQDNAPATGSVRVHVEDAAYKTIGPDPERLEIASYRISGKFGGGKEDGFEKYFSGTEFTIENLVAGTWKFSVFAYNEAGLNVARCDNPVEVEIRAGECNDVAFYPEWVIGQCPLTLTITWERGERGLLAFTC